MHQKNQIFILIVFNQIVCVFQQTLFNAHKWYNIFAVRQRHSQNLQKKTLGSGIFLHEQQMII